MLAPNPSQHLESQSVSQRNPSRFHQSVKRSSVVVTPQGRLQISADLDVKGIGKLKQMLEQYEQILKLLQ
jgi:hypothetical protein